jgi:hypothetical protein
MAYLSSCEDNKRASSASSSSKGNKHIHNDDDDEIHHHIPKPRSLLTQSLEGYFQDRVLENVKPYVLIILRVLSRIPGKSILCNM